MELEMYLHQLWENYIFNLSFLSWLYILNMNILIILHNIVITYLMYNMKLLCIWNNYIVCFADLHGLFRKFMD
jgi:hypothetical protein